MKQLLYLFSAIIIIAIVPAYTIVHKATEYSEEQEYNHSLAKVQQIDNVYVFILSVPKSDYERLGVLEKHIALTGSNREMITSLIDKAKKQYSQCDAIIFTSYQFDNCEVIKFKN